MRKVKVVINEMFLQTCATGTLLGTLMKQNEYTLKGVTEVELVFPQTTMSWRASHSGPKIYLVPEYTLPCLLKDVLSLVGDGVKVSVVTNDS